MIAARLETPPMVARIANRRPPVARSRSGRVLHGDDIDQVILRGEHLRPAARRVLRVLMSEEGRLFTFGELAELASVRCAGNDAFGRANRLHFHIHHIRRALIDECWIDCVVGIGAVFLRR